MKRVGFAGGGGGERRRQDDGLALEEVSDDSRRELPVDVVSENRGQQTVAVDVNQ